MLIDRQQFFKHIQKCGTLSNEQCITWYWINWQLKKYVPVKSKNCKLFADILMLLPESRRSPRYDISAYSNEFGKFSTMLLPIIVNWKTLI
jgi:hypothetical protein